MLFVRAKRYVDLPPPLYREFDFSLSSIIFKHNDAQNVEDSYLLQDNDYEIGNEINIDSSKSCESGEEDIVDNDNDFDENRVSDGEDNRPSRPVFNPVMVFDPTFEIGMIFRTKAEFRKIVQSHPIRTKRTLKFIRSGINALKMNDECTFQIREYNPKHSCPLTFHVKNIKTNWLSERYIKKFQSDPKRNVEGFRIDVINDIRCHVSKQQAYRAKRKALSMIEGNPDIQYLKLWDYAEELRKTSLGSTIILGTEEQNRKKRFNKFYIYFNALKTGFLSGGLIQALEEVFPDSDNKFCVRHLHNNFKIDGYRGLAFKNALWRAAQATTLGEFKVRMKKIKNLNESTVDWFHDKPPAQWSKSHFNEGPKCDMLLNNICETFNSNILDAREKPIITMLEWIREYLMRRLQENRDRAEASGKENYVPKLKR
ncbi:hypothetical protein Pfo_006990 [Paulownia fortunei]|nr:hypothetical protein Pfo_006990 [Paulownia fortunei]